MPEREPERGDVGSCMTRSLREGRAERGHTCENPRPSRPGMMVVVRCGKRAGAQGVRRRPFPGSRSGLAFRTLWRQSRMAASVGARNAKVKSFAASRHEAEAIAGGVPIAATQIGRANV